MVDMAHYAGLIAGGKYPNPVPHAHVVTSTTHKTLRGPPRGGVILTNDADLAKKLNSAVFPGNQGGPLNARHRRQGGCLRRGAAARIFRLRGQVIANAQALAKVLRDGGSASSLAGRIATWCWSICARKA